MNQEIRAISKLGPVALVLIQAVAETFGPNASGKYDMNQILRRLGTLPNTWQPDDLLSTLGLTCRASEDRKHEEVLRGVIEELKRDGMTMDDIRVAVTSQPITRALQDSTLRTLDLI